MKIDIFGDGKFIIRTNFPIYLSILNVLSYHFKRENCLYDFQPNSKYLYTCTNQCRIYPSLPLYLQKKRRYNIDTENGGRNIFVGLAAPSSLLIRLSTLMLDIACLFVCCFGCLLFVGLFVGFFTNAYHGMAVWFSLLKENFILAF